ncbi:ATP-binding protein [Pedobacter sp.]|uniref:ATP-binding protein n=1 Tax=Pedobacter sp. TaxID=1411316 RepID=UPI003BA84FCC
MYNRFIIDKLKIALKVSPVVYLNGPRQAGKSTLVLTSSKVLWPEEEKVNYITFDRPTQMAAAAAEPEAFLSAQSGKVIIDEVQMVPELFPALKIVVDESRFNQPNSANGKFLLTGSAKILALPKLSNPLVGRMNVLTLYPFCTAEALSGNGNGLEKILSFDFSDLKNTELSIIEAMSYATYPEISGKDTTERNVWFDGYITTILQRDVRMIAELEKISILPSLLRLLASRAANLVNDADLARDLGLNPVTGKLYRNILKMMFLNFDVEPWFRNINKRLVKSPKNYLTDTMMLCYMLELNLEDISKNRPDLFGHILENYVAAELTKLISFSDIKTKLYHFLTSDGIEVDFILESADGGVFAIEVKKTENLSVKDFKGIKVFADLVGEDFRGGIILYSGKEAVPFGNKLWAVPFHILWQ